MLIVGSLVAKEPRRRAVGLMVGRQQQGQARALRS